MQLWAQSPKAKRLYKVLGFDKEKGQVTLQDGDLQSFTLPLYFLKHHNWTLIKGDPHAVSAGVQT